MIKASSPSSLTGTWFKRITFPPGRNPCSGYHPPTHVQLRTHLARVLYSLQSHQASRSTPSLQPCSTTCSGPRRLKRGLLSHLLTGFLPPPSALPEHSLHCTNLIKSFLVFTLHQAPSDSGCEPSTTGPQPTPPASSHFSLSTHDPAILSYLQCRWCRAFSRRHTFAHAAFPAWEALPPLAVLLLSSRPSSSITSLRSLS